jgi:hypothetical protein
MEGSKSSSLGPHLAHRPPSYSLLAGGWSLASLGALPGLDQALHPYPTPAHLDFRS